MAGKKSFFRILRSPSDPLSSFILLYPPLSPCTSLVSLSRPLSLLPGKGDLGELCCRIPLLLLLLVLHLFHFDLQGLTPSPPPDPLTPDPLNP